MIICWGADLDESLVDGSKAVLSDTRILRNGRVIVGDDSDSLFDTNRVGDRMAISKVDNGLSKCKGQSRDTKIMIIDLDLDIESDRANKVTIW